MTRSFCSCQPHGTHGGKVQIYNMTSGSMACIVTPGSITRGIAFSSLLVRTRQATQRSSDSGMATARVRSPGKRSCCTSKAADLGRRQPGPLGMGHWGAGRHCAQCTGRRVGNGVGCLRRSRSETNCPKTCSRRPSTACKRSGWPQSASGRLWRWPCASPPRKRSIPRRPSAWPRIARWYGPSMIAPLSPGATFARPSRSHRRLPPCAHAPIRRADASPGSQCSRWCSNCSRVRPSGGRGCGLRITGPRSCRAWPSRMGSG